jgi:hypothetical protein
MGNGGSVDVYYDKSAPNFASECPPPTTPGGCKSCLDCANQKCNTGTGQCTGCATDADCCAPLRCVGGVCEFTSF